MAPWIPARVNGAFCFNGKDVVTPSPKGYHKGNKKTDYYEQIDSSRSQSDTSEATISLNSFLSCDSNNVSPLGLSIPDLEASSASEMSVDHLKGAPQNGMGAPVSMKGAIPYWAESEPKSTPAAAPADDINFAWVSPSPLDGTNSPDGLQVNNQELKNNTLSMPPLATVVSPDDASQRSPTDSACRMPKRTRSKKRPSRSSACSQRRFVFAGEEEKPQSAKSRWEKPRQSKGKDKKDVAPSIRRRTVDTDDSDNELEAVLGPTTSSSQSRMHTSLRHMRQETQPKRHSENKPKSESFLFNDLNDSRRQRPINSRRTRASLEMEEQPKRRKSGGLRDLRRKPKSETFVFNDLNDSQGAISSRRRASLETEEQPKRRKSGSLRDLRRRRSSKTASGAVERTNSSSLRNSFRRSAGGHGFSGNMERTNSSSLRNSFRRSAEGLGSFLMPKRSSTSSAHGVRRNVSRSSSKHGAGSGHRRISLAPAPGITKDMNIFCSEIVSTDYILSQIQEAKENPEIVRLELEDLLERCTTDIALAVKDLLVCDDRPWEGVHFMDEVRTDGLASYRPWLQRKRHIFRHLGNVCTLKLIPMVFSTELIIEDGNGIDNDDSILSVPDDDEDLVGLLRKLKSDASVTKLKLSTSHSTPAIVKELITLFQCDDRNWESVQLKLSGKAPFPKNSPEHEHWCEVMKAYGQDLQQVAQERGIRLTE